MDNTGSTAGLVDDIGPVGLGCSVTWTLWPEIVLQLTPSERIGVTFGCREQRFDQKDTRRTLKEKKGENPCEGGVWQKEKGLNRKIILIRRADSYRSNKTAAEVYHRSVTVWFPSMIDIFIPQLWRVKIASKDKCEPHFSNYLLTEVHSENR